MLAALIILDRMKIKKGSYCKAIMVDYLKK